MSESDHAGHTMGERGVTRHGMSHGDGDDGHGDQHQHGDHADKDDGHAEHGGHMHMSHEQRHKMLVEHHHKTLWIWWTLVMLGVWMVLTPLTFDYARDAVQVPGRTVWLSFENRLSAMFWSDIASGALLIVLGWRTLTPGRPISQWAACFVGIWLTVAPLIFWSPSPLAYLNDTFVGVLVISLTILIPGMPNMVMMMEHGPQTPPGWSYNPSSWPQRWIMIVLGLAGWVVSRYLAARQLGYLDKAWDPLFGGGSEKVLMSKMSHTWPISDAALGAFSYTFEFLMGFMGSPARWRTMPWMVLFFGILVIPLGLTHVLLVISQPVMVGHWCALCLLAAAIMLPMIPLEVDEVVAMCQFMRKSVWRDKQPFWRTFWKGGTVEMQEDGRGGSDDRSPPLHTLPQRPMGVIKASVWGMSVPWTLAVCAALGLWMMFAPSVFGTAAGDTPGSFTIADASHLGGALVVVVAVCAMGEVIRAGRWLNVLLGLWLIVTPFAMSGSNVGSTINSVMVGLAVIALTPARGKVTEHYGAWDRWVR